MPRYVFWVQTTGSESRRELVLEVPECELAGTSEFSREEVLEQYSRVALSNLVAMGWYPVDGRGRVK